MENPNNYVLDQNIKIEVIKNGQKLNSDVDYPIGQRFSPNFYSDFKGWENLVEGDVLEVKISNY